MCYCCCIVRKPPRATQIRSCAATNLHRHLCKKKICITTYTQLQLTNSKAGRLFTRYILLTTYRMIKTQSNRGRRLAQNTFSSLFLLLFLKLNCIDGVFPFNVWWRFHLEYFTLCPIGVFFFAGFVDLCPTTVLPNKMKCHSAFYLVSIESIKCN